MGYRNGTYIAFHAGGTTNPADSDIKFYHMLRMWHLRRDDEFQFIDSHEKTSAVRDSSSRETLRRALVTRLNNSKQMLLIVGRSTRFDTDWVPLEIRHAIDVCGLPIIAAYPDYEYIVNPSRLRHLWPRALEARIDDDTAGVIHIPFKKIPISRALARFDLYEIPECGLSYYSLETYRRWGIAS
jgi:hypothetical protein